MSLINDALKRAKRSGSHAQPKTDPETPLQPVEYRRSAPWSLLLVPMLVVILGVAAWFFLKGYQSHRVGGLLRVNTPVAARDVPTESQTSGNSQAQGDEAPTQPSPSNAVTRSKPNNTRTNLAVNTTDQAGGTAPEELSKPGFPNLRLQGIFYRPKSPSAMISGKTVQIGNKVAGAKVLAITRDSVTLEWNGETKVLTLE